MIRVNETVLEIGAFPNKESNVVIDEAIVDEGINFITFKYEDDSDLIKLLFVSDHISERSVAPKVLVIEYMPYSRLDRQEEGIAFTLKSVAKLINSMNFAEILVVEPHSDVTCALVDNSTAVPLTEKLFNESISSGVVNFDPAEDFVCYPDATAHKRYSKMGDYKAVIGMKDRDFKTGWINNLDSYVPGGYSVEGKNVVIVDDLCAKGGTFILTAKELRKLGAKSVTLIVAHCERTILDGEVLTGDLIDKVITSDTMADQKDFTSFDKMYMAKLEEII